MKTSPQSTMEPLDCNASTMTDARPASITSLETFFTARTSATSTNYACSSRPSSVSTNYGFYYTRQALSQEDVYSFYGDRGFSTTGHSEIDFHSQWGSSLDLVPAVVESSKTLQIPGQIELHGRCGHIEDHQIYSMPAYLASDGKWRVSIGARSIGLVEGVGNRSYEARTDAVKLVLEELSAKAELPLSTNRQYNSQDLWPIMQVRLGGYCRLLNHRFTPRYKYTFKSCGSGRRSNTGVYTVIILCGPYGSPCSWASDRKLEDAQERAAHYALTYLKRKHPDVPLDTSQDLQWYRDWEIEPLVIEELE